MKFILHIIGTVIANLLGLWITIRLLPSFNFSGNFTDLFILAAVLALLNWTIKPILKLVLGPIILLTLGLGMIAVNMIVLYILDILSSSLTMEENAMLALFLASIIMGFVNIVAHIIARPVQSP